VNIKAFFCGAFDLSGRQLSASCELRRLKSEGVFVCIITALGSGGAPFLNHDTRGGEPFDCGIVEAMLAQHFARML
jgi:hypothetical protein